MPTARPTTSETEETVTDHLSVYGADLVTPSRPARLLDVKNAITALVAGGADVNARCRLGASPGTLASPFRAVCTRYRGVSGNRR